MKEFLKKAKGFLRKSIFWLGADGMLHILVNMVIILSCVVWGSQLIGNIIAIAISIAKEVYDLIGARKENIEWKVCLKWSLHDLVCDIIGLLVANIICI